MSYILDKKDFALPSEAIENIQHHIRNMISPAFFALEDRPECRQKEMALRRLADLIKYLDWLKTKSAKNFSEEEKI